MAGFFAGGFDRYKQGLRERREARLAEVKASLSATSTQDGFASELESVQIEAEVAAIHADYAEQLSKAEGALF